MELKKTIKSNEELYGDFELIPLNASAVNQRIWFFEDKAREMLKGTYDTNELNKYIDAWNFWKEMKDKHCEKEVS